ncbi:CLUMA_CG002977, isoform A [Clunio marinus]|uniref:CLUMA_CG002977, isoform A n=1 Tax=Clunio marinus TaxID=568069 RepID=A0A1J1HNV9_9DIPT|nr:CLUMA_CG002977, isoform A [Clunio marinus]
MFLIRTLPDRDYAIERSNVCFTIDAVGLLKKINKWIMKHFPELFYSQQSSIILMHFRKYELQNSKE